MRYNQFSEHQMQNIQRVLLRPLQAGERFRVRYPLPNTNTNPSMKALEGQWVTVKMCRKLDVPSRTNFDPLYEELGLETHFYHIENDKSMSGRSNWLDYHMDIYGTNLRILGAKNKMAIRRAPNLPTI